MKITKKVRLLSTVSKPLFLLLALLFCLPSFAQDDEDFMHVYGTVKDYQSRRKMRDAVVTVTQDGKSFKSITTSANGKFEFFLPLDHKYVIKFGKDKYVSKNIEIDARNVPADIRRGGFSMNTDVDLFESIPDIDFSFLENPIGKASFYEETGDISWNYDYIESVKSKIDRLMKEYEKAKKEVDKEEETANKEEEERNMKFEKLMKDGGISLANKRYKDAVSQYQEALTLKPENETAKSKLDEAKKKLEEEQALAEANRKYNEFLDKGDDSFKAKNYEEAIQYYESALGIKADEKYPKDQIAQANLKLEEIARAEAEEKEFKDLVAKGDGELGENKFDEAINSYQQAQQLKPLDKDIKSKIEEAKKLKEEYLANKEKEEKYQGLITAADDLFASENYTESIAKYNEALKVKSKDEYAQGQIKKAEEAIELLKKQEEEAQALAEKEEQYNSYMSDGNRNMSDKKYNDAIANFKNALKIKENDPEASKKIEEATTAKEEMEANMAKQERYDSIVATAENQLESGDLEGSLSSYKEADAIISNELTQTKIAEVEQMIADKKAKEEEERLLAEEEERKAMEQAELERAFNDLVAKGDNSHDQQDYKDAIDQYDKALAIYPEDKKVIAKLEKAQQSLEKANAEMAEAERLRKEEEERLAELERQRLEEEARQQALQEEKDRKAQEAQAIEDDYNRYVSIADDQFNDKNYDLALENYNAALAIKDDKYPQTQIERINRLKEKMEEDRLEAERLAEEERRRAEELARQKELQRSKFDSDQEQEAEEYMAQLRAERRKEKINRSKEEKEKWSSTLQSYQQTEDELIDQNKEQIAEYKKDISEREARFNEAHKEKVESMANVKEEYQAQKVEKVEEQKNRISESKESFNEVLAYRKELEDRGNDNIERNNNEVKEQKTVNEEMHRKGYQLQERTVEDFEVDKRNYARNAERYSSEGAKKIADNNYTINNQKEAISQFKTTRATEAKDNGKEKLNQEKDNVQSFNDNKANEQYKRIQSSKEGLNNVERHNSKPSSSDYLRNPLADVYPQGVTEEKSVENNKVILTRYVVNGNKVDVYKKIIGMNGNFYFKNDVSCSENTWKRESTVVLE